MCICGNPAKVVFFGFSKPKTAQHMVATSQPAC